MDGVRRMGGLALATVTALATLSGCQNVRFRVERTADPDGAVLGLGGATPYIPEVRRPASAPAAAPVDVYAATRAGMLSPWVRALPRRLYVITAKGTVDILDPRSLEVLKRIRVPGKPLAVTPSWDLRTLWISTENGFVPLDPATQRLGRAVPAGSPRGLLFAPDGQQALVLNGKAGRVDLRDPRTLRWQRSFPFPCRDPAHPETSADGTLAVAICPATREIFGFDPAGRRVVASLALPGRAQPGEIRLAPDGSRFYVTDAQRGGFWTLDAVSLRAVSFMVTAPDASSLAFSRDSRILYVAGHRALTLVSGGRVTTSWPLTLTDPAIGGISEDGTTLWLVDRANGYVHALSTADGHELHRPAPANARALLPYPQPGRFSVGPDLR